MGTDDNVRFDARRFGALGSIGRGETALISILKRANVATLEEARRKPVVFGATGTTSGQYYLPSILNRLFGTRIRIIPGYKTMAEILLSMERGDRLNVRTRVGVDDPRVPTVCGRCARVLASADTRAAS
jgi:hypothetical protein